MRADEYGTLERKKVPSKGPFIIMPKELHRGDRGPADTLAFILFTCAKKQAIDVSFPRKELIDDRAPF